MPNVPFFWVYMNDGALCCVRKYALELSYCLEQHTFKLLQSCSLVLDLNALGICVNYYFLSLMIAVPDVLLRMLIVTRVGSTLSTGCRRIFEVGTKGTQVDEINFR
jgi:hypothetical protein